MRRVAGKERELASERVVRRIDLGIALRCEQIEEHVDFLIGEVDTVRLDDDLEGFIRRSVVRGLHFRNDDRDRLPIFANRDREHGDLLAAGPRLEFQVSRIRADVAAAIREHDHALNHVCRLAVDHGRDRIGDVGSGRDAAGDLDAPLELGSVFLQDCLVFHGHVLGNGFVLGFGEPRRGPVRRAGGVQLPEPRIANGFRPARGQALEQERLEVVAGEAFPLGRAPRGVVLGEGLRFFVEPATEAVEHHRVLFEQVLDEGHLLVGQQVDDGGESRLPLLAGGAADLVRHFRDARRHVQDHDHAGALLAAFVGLEGGE